MGELEQAVAGRLRSVMERSGIVGNRALADICRTTPSAVNNWLSAYNLPRVPEMMRLCERTGTTLDWVYRGSAAAQDSGAGTCNACEGAVGPASAAASREGEPAHEHISPDADSAWFRSEIEALFGKAAAQSGLARFMAAMGDNRAHRTILRTVSNYACGHTRISGEMSALVTLLRHPDRARAIAEQLAKAPKSDGSSRAPGKQA